MWWRVEEVKGSDNLTKIFLGLVVNCPASTVRKEKDGQYPSGKPKHRRIFSPVSARGCSFRERGIRGDLLRTVTAQIKRSMGDGNFFKVVKPSESVENVLGQMVAGAYFADPYFEIAVFMKRDGLSESETFFYCVRNAFAHGSFQVIAGNDPVYVLESKKGDKVLSRIRLKESTLLACADLAQKNRSEIKAFQKRKKR